MPLSSPTPDRSDEEIRRRQLPRAHYLLSTWDKMELCRIKVDDLVLSEDTPRLSDIERLDGADQPHNIEYRFLSTRRGLQAANTVKIWTSCSLEHGAMLHEFARFHAGSRGRRLERQA